MPANELLQCGAIRVELGTRTATVEIDGEIRALELTRLEFDVLTVLVRARGEAVAREVLLDRVWGRSKDVTDHAIDSAVSELRAKLDPARWVIRTVRGVGYAIAVPTSPTKQGPRSRSAR